ncbi:FAD-dependent thymidylate synthase [Bdellovibrio sp. HCB337]|uniref:FAD-dependent thymidylate synthase n=1 Tax=Bdellovibrio sp. HCB337 TaxID=3394358 RepID=UPI0039A56AFE
METNNVRLISITPNAEEIMAYCARVSNPVNQENPEISRLIAYCIKHGHWSIFEQANMVLEITTSRAISPQILRHRSFSFQEFSQRYAEVDGYIEYSARRQDQKNRQNSVDDLDADTQSWFAESQKEVWDLAFSKYKMALEKGIAKECARTLLPMGTSTRLYMNGTVRSWIHYIQLRSEIGTQLEHRMIAEACKEVFSQQLPVVAKALGWI